MMMKKVSLLLPVLAVLLFMEIKGNPVIEADGSVDPKDPESSRILPKADWLNFHNAWSLPSLPSVTSFFNNEDKAAKEAGLMKTRIEALEQSQKDIISMLKKITQDIKPNSSPCANKKPEIVLPQKQEEPILPAKPTNNGKDKPKITKNPTTQESGKPESPMDDKKDNSSINEVLKETDSKPEIGTTAPEVNGGKLKSEITNENIALLGPVPQPETRMNGRMPSMDDVDSP